MAKIVRRLFQSWVFWVISLVWFLGRVTIALGQATRRFAGVSLSYCHPFSNLKKVFIIGLLGAVRRISSNFFGHDNMTIGPKMRQSEAKNGEKNGPRFAPRAV